jgi:predicted ATPase
MNLPGRGAARPKSATPRALGSGSPANRQQGDTPRLFGREEEQTRLRQLLDAAVAGSGSLVLIGGEAGIGKTALATSIERKAHGRRIPVWVGHCYELAATPPYGPWMDSAVFDQRSEDVPSPLMLGVDEGSGAATSQAALFEQMQEFLAVAVRQNPLVLILEDLHWADPASLELLRFVSRNLDGLRILLVVNPSCPLQALNREGQQEAHDL